VRWVACEDGRDEGRTARRRGLAATADLHKGDGVKTAGVGTTERGEEAETTRRVRAAGGGRCVRALGVGSEGWHGHRWEQRPGCAAVLEVESRA
jgi:hypothetical protein